MAQYAENTNVPVDRSKAEIERILIRYGAESFMHGWDQERAVIQFKMQERMIRFVLPLPSRDDPAFQYTPARRHRRDADGIGKAWEQSIRQRWRSLAMIIKAKLEAVESGITSLDEEFLSYTVLPDNSTVAEFMLPQVVQAYLTGKMPSMLPMLPPPTDHIDTEESA